MKCPVCGVKVEERCKNERKEEEKWRSVNKSKMSFTLRVTSTNALWLCSEYEASVHLSAHVSFATLLLLFFLTHGVNRPFYSFLSFIEACRGGDRRVLSAECVCRGRARSWECK